MCYTLALNLHFLGYTKRKISSHLFGFLWIGTLVPTLYRTMNFYHKRGQTLTGKECAKFRESKIDKDYIRYSGLKCYEDFLANSIFFIFFQIVILSIRTLALPDVGTRLLRVSFCVVDIL